MQAEADIEQTALDTYSSIEVNVICRVHGQRVKPVLLKEGLRVWVDPEPIGMPGQEVMTIIMALDFSDDPFKTYTCRAVDPDTEDQLAERTMYIRNPFFLQSHGECGIQLARNLVKRDALTHGHFEPRVTIGRDISFPGQVPWQAIVSANISIPGDSEIKERELCGGTIISAFHILTAAHCLKVQECLVLTLTT